MQWNDVQKDWKVLGRQFKAKWPKLTDADITAIEGKRPELVKRLEKHYELEKPKLEQEIDAFIKTLKTKV